MRLERVSLEDKKAADALRVELRQQVAASANSTPANGTTATGTGYEPRRAPGAMDAAAQAELQSMRAALDAAQHARSRAEAEAQQAQREAREAEKAARASGTHAYGQSQANGRGGHDGGFDRDREAAKMEADIRRELEATQRFEFSRMEEAIHKAAEMSEKAHSQVGDEDRLDSRSRIGGIVAG